MRRLLGMIDAISEWSGKLLGVFIAGITCILLLEVTTRYLLNAPTAWAHEISLSLFGSCSVLGGAYVLLRFSHVKVDVFYSRFSLRKRAILDSVNYLGFFLFVGLMLVYGIPLAYQAVKVRESFPVGLQGPLYPLKISIPVGAFLLLLQGLAHWIRALHMAITGRELA